MIFMNFSNHPTSKWDEAQLAAARALGEVVDLPFPNVPVEAQASDIPVIADKICSQIPVDAVVMAQGEWTLTYAVTKRLRARGIRVVVTTSRREVEETQNEDGSTRKVAIFRFCGFRDIE
jgi:hypothetical protein